MPVAAAPPCLALVAELGVLVKAAGAPNARALDARARERGKRWANASVSRQRSLERTGGNDQSFTLKLEFPDEPGDSAMRRLQPGIRRERFSGMLL